MHNEKDLIISDVYNLLYSENKNEIISNMYYFLTKNDDYASIIINYFLINYNDNKDIVYKISRNRNLHIRYLFMSALIKNYNNLLNDIYPNIISQLKTKTKLMDNKEICKLAILFYKNNDLLNYYKIKKFILENYKYNYLASNLIELDENDNEFINNVEEYYNSSIDKKLYIYKYYSEYLSKEIKDDMSSKIKYFLEPEQDFRPIDRVYEDGLGDKFNELVEKYLSLSKDNTYELLDKGSVTWVYKIGDYVFKISKQKYSCEDIICPNCFMIIKNNEEIYLRNKNNEVYLGIEVQKYLTKKIEKFNYRCADEFEKHLKEQGYYVDDTLVYGNLRVLDSYLDADTTNVDDLPDWFKKRPIVLVDRDLVFKLDNKNPKKIFRR